MALWRHCGAVLDRLADEQVVDYFTKGALALALASWLSQRVAEKQQVTVSSPTGSGEAAHIVDPLLMEGATALREMLGQLSGAATEVTAARPLSVAKVEAPKQSACVALLAPRRNTFLQMLEAWLPKLLEVIGCALAQKLSSISAASGADTELEIFHR